MKKTLGKAIAGVFGLLVTLTSMVLGRSKEPEGFPDYNKLEYARPLPAPDQQVPELPPGSIKMRVGERKETNDQVPLDSLPVSVRGTPKYDNGEPPLDFFEDTHTAAVTPPSILPVESTTTIIETSTSTTPAADAPKTKTSPAK